MAALRCDGCSMPLRLCLCETIPCVESLTRLVLVVPAREIRKPTNTGALAARCLVNSEVHVTGRKDDGGLVYGRLVADDATNLLLFPSDHAVPLTAAFCAALPRPVRLIVPDGHWGQASDLRRKFPAGSPLIHVTLPPGPPTAYGLRRETNARPAGLATLEAIARALEAIEGTHVSAPLLEVFRVFVARTLWSRGKLAAADVYGGLPPP